MQHPCKQALYYCSGVATDRVQACRAVAQVLIYGIYTCACWALLSDELPVGDGAANDAHSAKQAAQDGLLSAGSTPMPGPAAPHGETLMSGDPGRLLARREAAYLAGLPALEAFSAVVHPLLLPRLPFLPLLLTSVYCAAGMSWAWWRMARHYLGEAPRTKAE